MNYKKSQLICLIAIFSFYKQVICGMNCPLGQYYDGSNCVSCPDTLCQDCDQSGCTQCNQAARFRKLVGTQCVPIDGYFEQNNYAASQCGSHCKVCTNVNKCDQCFPKFYLQTNDRCYSCLNFCESCATMSYCDDCQYKYGLYEVNPNIRVCRVCSYNQTNCQQCEDVLKCTKCANPYVVEIDNSAPYYKCVLCSSITNCLTCIDGPQCQTCDYGYYLDANLNQCTQCTSNKCLTCTSATVCTSCQTYFQTDATNNCIQICGDGIVIYLTCDIFPRRQFDGCSDQCTQETDFTCNINGNPNTCSYHGSIAFTINTITKSTFENTLQVQIKFQPALTIFLDDPETYLFPYLTLNDQNGNKLQVTYSQKGGQNSFVATVSNTRSLQNQQISLLYDPSSSNLDHLQYTTQNSMAFQMIPSNSYAYYYSQSEYLACRIFNYLSFAIAAFLLLLMILELFCNNMATIQVLLVVQFGYFSLFWYHTQYLMPPYSCLSPLWLANGYNYHYESPSHSKTVSSYTFDGTSYLASNYNIMLFLIIIIPIMCKLIIFIFKFLPSDRLKTIGEEKADLFYQWALNFQIFGFTQFVNFLLLFYGTPSITTTQNLKDIPSNIVTIIGIISFFLVFICYLIDPSKFGKFNINFCLTFLSKRTYLANFIFIIIMLVLARFLFGYFLIIGQCISFILLIYMLAYRPYFSQVQNIRSALAYFGYSLFFSLRIFFQFYDSQDENSSDQRLPEFIYVGVIVAYLVFLSFIAMIQLIYQFVDRYYIQPRLRQGLLFHLFDKDTSHKKGMQQFLQMKKFFKKQQVDTSKTINFMQDPMYHYKKINVPKIQNSNKSNIQENEQHQIPQSIKNQDENSPNMLMINVDQANKCQQELIDNREKKVMQELIASQNQIIRFQVVKLFMDRHGKELDKQLIKQFDQI